ncbi:MAG: hypothetical protein K2K99_08055 [Muribaculaceae bacterium]|nr:hypothetical protein [Muribaculaceae bacterium]
MKGKKIYQQPETVVTRVELESPICSGSVDITVESPNNTSVNAQEVSDFGGANDFYGGTWDETTGM